MVRIDEEWLKFETFLDVYHETMLRRGAERSYFYSREHFLELRKALGQHLLLCLTEIDGTVAAAAIFTEYNGVVNYHLSGTGAAFVRERPTKIMIDFMRRWAKDRGNHFLHLGGGLGGRQDSLFAFKAGFSDLRFPFSSLRVIIDGPTYRTLAGRWEALTGISADDPEGYFPAYRKFIEGKPFAGDRSYDSAK